MDETLWCPLDTRNESLLMKASRSPNPLWDAAYGQVEIPALKVGDSADINDTVKVRQNGCVNTIYQTARDATVKVHGDLDGSGFFVDKQGLIATAAHLVPPPNNTVIV